MTNNTFFVKSAAGADIARSMGLSVMPGVKDYFCSYGSHTARSSGYIVVTSMSRTALKRAGLLVSAVFNHG